MNYTKITASSGAVLGAAENRTLYSSDLASPVTNLHQMSGLHTFIVSIVNDQTLSLILERNAAVIGTWTAVQTVAVGIPAAGNANVVNFLIEPYHNFRIRAVGGGTIQGVWIVDMAMSDDRASAS